MATEYDCVQLSGAVYARTFANRMFVPNGWIEVERIPDDAISGFSAGVYRKGDEIVIAFTGTNQSQWKDYVQANVPATLGLTSSQVVQAAAKVIDVMRAYPAATISFTGHSLGGGLASVMAVMFDKPAKIFDPAPFEPTARNPETLSEIASLLSGFGYSDAKLQRYVDGGGIDFPALEGNVRSWYVEGEILVPLRIMGGTIVGPSQETPISVGNPSLLDTVNPFVLFGGRVSLHSVTLLHSLLASPKFNKAISSQPFALETFFDTSLYARDPEKSDSADFLTRLLLMHIGNGTAKYPGNTALDTLAVDLDRLLPTGTTGSERVTRALLAALTEHYHIAESVSELFRAIAGAVHFDVADILPEESESKALPRLVSAIQSLSPRDRDLLAHASRQQSWHIQSGDGLMVWSDSADRSDLAVGGNGDDILRGGGGDDILLGRDGADTLDGGDGADNLIGGNGFDQYIVGRGIDVIRDDFYGDGMVRTEAGVVLAGGRAAGRRYAWVGANEETYTFIPARGSGLGTLVIGNIGSGNAVRIDNFDLTRAQTTSYLGIKLDSTIRAVVGEAGGGNPFATYLSDATPTSGHTVIAEGTGHAYTVHLNIAAHAGDKITLALPGVANAFQAVLGDVTVPADGAVITLVEGQTEVSFGLLQTGDVDADMSGGLRVTYAGVNGTATSNTWDIALTDDGGTAAPLNGDQTYATYVASADIRRDGRIVVNRGEIAFRSGADGNLVPGGDVSITDNVLYGTAGNDRINGLTGNDALDAGAGNDWLDGGTGDDLIAGGAGHNTLMGGAGNDFILGAGNLRAGLQQLGPNDRWQAPTGKLVYGNGSTWGVYRDSDLLDIWDGAADAGGIPEASAIDAGDGDDQVIAGPGDDLVDGGAGNDWLDGTAGSDFILGGEGNDRIQADGIVKPGYLNTTSPDAHGSDFVDGGGEDDDIQGGGQGDVLFGGNGNDRIWGDSGGRTDNDLFVPLEVHGADYIDGEDGDDYLEGGGGDDTIYGGTGSDRLWGDTTADNIVGNAAGETAATLSLLAYGNDYLDGEDGSDSLVGGGGDDALYGGAGNDRLWGDEDNAALPSEFNGADLLDGGDGDDYLAGGGGSDELVGGSGNDTLDGGTGLDTMAGESGNDVYLVDNVGDIVIEAVDGGDDLVISSIDIALPENVERLTLTGDAAIDAMGNDADNTLTGGPGTNRLEGLAGNDALVGGGGADTLIGGAGDDLYQVDDAGDVVVEAPDEGTDFVRTTVDYVLQDNVEHLAADGVTDLTLAGNALGNGLFGNVGNNILAGRAGNDYLVGGAGNDVYVFGRGDGQDAIDNTDATGAVDTLRFGPGITESDVTGMRSGDDLILRVKGSTDLIRVIGHYAPAVASEGTSSDRRLDRIEFADGATWDDRAIQAAAERAMTNHAPTAGATLQSVAARAGFSFTYTIPPDVVTDPDAGDSIAYSVRMPDGSAVPSWLRFDAATRTLVGAPGTDNAGSLQLVVLGTDTYGLQSGQYLTLNVAEYERAPVLASPLPDQAVAIGTAFSLALPSTAFRDPDAGDGLSYGATLADGSPLPSWLQFDPVSRTFSGTPVVPGTTSVRVTATDPFQRAVSDAFDIAVIDGTTIVGTNGADWLVDGPGNDTLKGLDGNDTLSAGVGNDRLDGGPGDDDLRGGSGGDTYVFAKDYGHDRVDESGGDSSLSTYDIVEFGSGVTAAEVVARRNRIDDLVLTITTTGDTLTVADYFWKGMPAYHQVEQFRFADGTLWDVSTITELVAIPTAGPDNLYGTDGPDVLDGGAGDDYLEGGAGADTYRFGKGYGVDWIYDTDPSGTAAVDAIEFASGVTPSEVHATRRDAWDLVLTIPATGDQLVVSSWFGESADGSSTSRIETIRFADGTIWDVATVKALVTVGTTGDDNLYGYDGTDDVLDGGAGNDYLNGMAGNDRLQGGSGNDSVYGTGGDDVLDGGTGNDYLDGGLGSDTYLFGKGSGQDWIFNIDYGTNKADVVRLGPDVKVSDVSLTRWSDYLILTIVPTGDTLSIRDFFRVDSGRRRYKIEQLQFGDGTIWTTDDIDRIAQSATLNGTSGADTLTSGVGDDTLNGLGGNDVLSSGGGNDRLDGGAGADKMAGGTGDDVYVVDSTADIVTENPNEGIDSVESSAGLTLAANVENLTLTGASAINGTGNALDNMLIGNGAVNALSGGAGNDRLDGRAGADKMAGGTGDDTYIIDNTGDVVTENANEGIDAVESSVSWTLPSNVENLRLTGTSVINGTGNALNNVLVGNAAANTLTGGAGADTMRGGAGDDVYAVDNVADTVVEDANAGTDTVKAGVTYTLPPNVENLTLTGTVAINATGNALANVLTGNAAANALTGGEGDDRLDGLAGVDTMAGGLGDDTYVVDVSADVIVESADEGSDTVESGVTLTLGANLENLILTGTKASNGTGNALANLVRGNTANNLLNGGAGNDILEGGAGSDTLTDTSGTALFNGGAGADILTGSAGTQIFVGGLGNDTLTTGAGNDIVLFNKGDGQDVLAAGDSGQDTLSLGGGVRYADLSFTRSSSDLVLSVGATDKITFKDWYAATPTHSFVNLQMIADAMGDFAAGGQDPLRDNRVEQFSFAGLVGAFDAARAANPALTSWALANALTSFQTTGSDTAALGGDLAYQYGRGGTLASIGVTPAFGVLSDPTLGSSAQTLTPLSALQIGTLRLT